MVERPIISGSLLFPAPEAVYGAARNAPSELAQGDCEASDFLDKLRQQLQHQVIQTERCNHCEFTVKKNL
jgi:hypothetical protein